MAFENAKKAGIILLLKSLKDYFLQIKDAIKTVNGTEPDDDGNVQINSVPYAQNLESDSSHRNYETFTQRTAGGDGTVDNGDAWLMRIKGNNTHDGYVAEEITPSSSNAYLTVTIDRDTFVAAVSGSQTLTLTYSSGSWSEDPATYGITVTGTPENNDTITVVYVEEERGTITVATPTAFVATGWNLYNHGDGCARVKKYAYGYRIDGSFTALQYSATYTGEKTSITVTDGAFDIPGDGFVWVTGGDSTTTAIYPTWEDWTEGHSGDFQAHTQSIIDLNTALAPFPYGLLKAGSAQDELDLNLGQAISRVERMDYSAANRAIAEASGREYEFDTDYIYLARATAVISTVTISGAFQVDDHGLEYFAGTDVDVDTEILYGNNLKNKLERDVLTISQQTLTTAQKTQVQQNIGVTDALSSLLVVEKRQLFDNTTVAANDFISSEYVFNQKTGYTAIGIVGVEIRNATSGGVGSSLTSYNMCYLRSETKAYIQLRNSSSNSAKLQMNVYVLFVKNL